MDLLFNLTKVVEKADGKHEVWGLATAELPDRDNEICDYAGTKPYYKSWSESRLQATSSIGVEPSLGNVRLQHTGEMAGKVTALNFDDLNKRIEAITEPLPNAWELIKSGIIIGYSQGGSYVSRVCAACTAPLPLQKGHRTCPQCRRDVMVKYIANPGELSYVDSPCLAEATFTYVKSNGSMELKKFYQQALPITGKPAPLYTHSTASQLVSKSWASLSSNLALIKFSENQARDAHGRWSSGGSAGQKAYETSSAAVDASRSVYAEDNKTLISTNRHSHVVARDAHMAAVNPALEAAHAAQNSGDKAGRKFYVQVAHKHKQAARNHARIAAGGHGRAAAYGALVGALAGPEGAAVGALYGVARRAAAGRNKPYQNLSSSLHGKLFQSPVAKLFTNSR